MWFDISCFVTHERIKDRLHKLFTFVYFILCFLLLFWPQFAEVIGQNSWLAFYCCQVKKLQIHETRIFLFLTTFFKRPKYLTFLSPHANIPSSFQKNICTEWSISLNELFIFEATISQKTESTVGFLDSKFLS